MFVVIWQEKNQDEVRQIVREEPQAILLCEKAHDNHKGIGWKVLPHFKSHLGDFKPTKKRR